MKEDKLSCKRCKARIVVGVVPYTDYYDMKRLGWARILTNTIAGDFDLCPHCGHELKRFLAGHAISTVKEVR